MVYRNSINLAVSAHGYGAEQAFDYRAYKTGYTVIKPKTGKEFLQLLKQYSKQGPIANVKIFSHSYPRGVIMTNWSGFYKSPGPEDTSQAAYIADLQSMVENNEIVFSSNATIILYGCNIANENFAKSLSRAINGTVIGAWGGVYPEISGGKETGVFISTDKWTQYTNGYVSIDNMGKRIRAW